MTEPEEKQVAAETPTHPLPEAPKGEDGPPAEHHHHLKDALKDLGHGIGEAIGEAMTNRQ